MPNVFWIQRSIGLLLVIGGLFFPSAVFAIEAKGISFFPTFSHESDSRTSGWFLYTIKPAERFIDYVTVFNAGESEISLALYAVDAVATPDGSFALGEKKGSRSGIGVWVRMGGGALPIEGYSLNEKQLLALPAEEAALPFIRENADTFLREHPLEFLQPGEALELRIPAKERRVIPFEMALPSDIEIFDHAGGIIAEDRTPKKKGSIAFVNRVGVRIYESVPGERREKFEIGKIHTNDHLQVTSLNVQVKNTGNVRIEPILQIIAKNIFTRQRREFTSLPEKVILPRQEALIFLNWPKRGFGLYQFEANLRTSQISQKIGRGYYADMGFVAAVSTALLMLLSISFITFGLKKKQGN